MKIQIKTKTTNSDRVLLVEDKDEDQRKIRDIIKRHFPEVYLDHCPSLEGVIDRVCDVANKPKCVILDMKILKKTADQAKAAGTEAGLDALDHLEGHISLDRVLILTDHAQWAESALADKRNPPRILSKAFDITVLEPQIVEFLVSALA